VVRQALTRQAFRRAGLPVRGVLLLTLLVALGILVTLLTDVAVRGDAGLPNAAPTSSQQHVARGRAGVLQGIVGSVSLMVFVVVLAFPIGIAAAIYLEEYARDTGSPAPQHV
jgi:phosphate transport system permease protein